MTSRGRPTAVVASKRVRSGQFGATIPAGLGRSYLVQVGRRAVLRLHVARGPAATVTLDRTTVRAGERLGYTLTNIGDTPLTTGLAYGIERPAAAGWEVVPMPGGYAFPLPAFGIPFDGTLRMAATVWPELGPGRYRLAHGVWHGDLGTAYHAASQFDVVP